MRRARILTGETELEMAERHVRLGQQRIERQRQLIEELRLNGCPTSDEERYLELFVDLQGLHEAHLARLKASY